MMNEDNYIKVTNRVNITSALRIMRDVMPGDNYGITPDELLSIMKPLREIEIRLFSLIVLKVE